MRKLRNRLPKRRKYRKRRSIYGRRTGGFRNPQRVEFKCVDVTLNNAPITPNNSNPTNSRFLLVNGVKQGTGINNRIGRRILMKSLYIRGTTYAIDSNQTPPWNMRMIVLFDKQHNGSSSPPVITEVLKEFDGFDTTQTDYATPLNISNAARFSILLDKVFTCQNYASDGSTSHSAGSSGTKAIRVYKKMNLFTQYNEGTSGNAADINSGALWILFMLDLDAVRVSGAIAEGNKPKVDLTVRLRYTD